MYASRNFDDAIAQWKKVKESYASLELTTLAELKIADAHFENEAYIEAAAAYEDFRKLHPANDKAPYALYRQGLSYFKQIIGIDTDQTPVKSAVASFQSFLNQYPKSPFVAEVREKLEDSRQKQVEHEIYVGKFYLKTEKYPAAIKRLGEALAKYPKSPVHDETLFCLGKAYMLSGDKVRGRDTFKRMMTEFPASRFLDEAKKVMEEYY